MTALAALNKKEGDCRGRSDRQLYWNDESSQALGTGPLGRWIFVPDSLFEMPLRVGSVFSEAVVYHLRASLPCGQGPCKGAARDAWVRHGVGARQVIDNIETVY